MDFLTFSFTLPLTYDVIQIPILLSVAESLTVNDLVYKLLDRCGTVFKGVLVSRIRLIIDGKEPERDLELSTFIRSSDQNIEVKVTVVLKMVTPTYRKILDGRQLHDVADKSCEVEDDEAHYHSVGRVQFRDDFRYPDFIRRVTLPRGAQYIPSSIDAPTVVTARDGHLVRDMNKNRDNRRDINKYADKDDATEVDEITIELGTNGCYYELHLASLLDRSINSEYTMAGGPEGEHDGDMLRFFKCERFGPLRAAKHGFKKWTDFLPQSRLLLLQLDTELDVHFSVS